jgi:type VI secretion system protein VasD
MTGPHWSKGEAALAYRKGNRVPRVLVSGLVAAGLLGACGGAPVVEPPAPVTVVVEANASPSVNPDVDGRPSPVVVRVYSLADDAAFAKSEFFALWDREPETLAAALLGRRELVLVPGGRQELQFELDPKVRSIGAAAALRDFRGATWKAGVAIPEPVAPGSTIRLVVDVDSHAVAARWQ